jgi:hypothetical protein
LATPTACQASARFDVGPNYHAVDFPELGTDADEYSCGSAGTQGESSPESDIPTAAVTPV